MSKGHNKKRNVGLIYEQIVRQATIATTENRASDAKTYVQFVTKHFVEGSELLKEFKLFNAILETSGVSEKVADRVLELARETTRSIDVEKLHREKGTLINEANRLFGKGSLFATPVENFRALATVQSLLNEWQSPGTLSASSTAKYESQLVQFMMIRPEPQVFERMSGINETSLNMFHKRFDSVYGDKLTDTQKGFLNDLTFLDKDQITQIIFDTKERVLQLLIDHHASESNSLLKEKYEVVRKNIETMNYTDHSAPSRQLTLLQLIAELEDENE